MILIPETYLQTKIESCFMCKKQPDCGYKAVLARASFQIPAFASMILIVNIFKITEDRLKPLKITFLERDILLNALPLWNKNVFDFNTQHRICK